MKPDKQYTNWTDKMYNYLAWCLFKNMYGTTEWFEEEEKKIALLKKNIGNVLDDKQRKLLRIEQGD